MAMHEEAERLLRMSRELRSKHSLAHVLGSSREATMAAYNNHTDKIDHFTHILDPPHIRGNSIIDKHYLIRPSLRGLVPVI